MRSVYPSTWPLGNDQVASLRIFTTYMLDGESLAFQDWYCGLWLLGYGSWRCVGQGAQRQPDVFRRAIRKRSPFFTSSSYSFRRTCGSELVWWTLPRSDLLKLLLRTVLNEVADRFIQGGNAVMNSASGNVC